METANAKHRVLGTTKANGVKPTNKQTNKDRRHSKRSSRVPAERKTQHNKTPVRFISTDGLLCFVCFFKLISRGYQSRQRKIWLETRYNSVKLDAASSLDLNRFDWTTRPIESFEAASDWPRRCSSTLHQSDFVSLFSNDVIRFRLKKPPKFGKNLRLPSETQ